MKRSIASILIVGATLLPGSLAPSARAATTILHNFTGSASDGGYPQGSLTLSGSKLYGMTSGGGGSNQGVLFSMNTDGTDYSLLHTFAGGIFDGANPAGSLTLSGSKLYGMTKNGGGSDAGTIFSINTDGTGFRLLLPLSNGPDGYDPEGSLTLSGSKLYGMTYDSRSGYGTVFSLNTDGAGLSVLHNFAGGINDGAEPYGSLTLSGSKLYGVTHRGGTDSIGINGGVVFSMNADGSGFSLLHHFDVLSGGAYSQGSLTLSGSMLYGTTIVGGSSFLGTLFSINVNGTGFRVLHNFTGSLSDGSGPQGSLTLFGSTLYGMTNRGGQFDAGTLFSIGANGSGFTLLESFGGVPANGRSPQTNDLVLSADGATFYGMTVQGGTFNQGVVFSRAVPEPGTFALLGLGTLFLSARRRSTPV